ncbi:MAG: ABC transporter permease [Oliverpabstia sp.]
MYGVQIAFKDYKAADGILGSAWVGLKHFKRFINLAQFKTILLNTLKLSVYGLVVGFPLPIILALYLNMLRSKKFSRVLQTVTYMPHFISLVVMVSMLTIFLSPTSGLYGSICRFFGVEATNLMGEAKAFRPIYIISDLWQHVGWNSIIYLAALAGVDPSLHESAMMDGASKLQRILHIDLPSIMPTCVIMLILSIGNILNVGYDKAYLLQNSLNLATSEIISTYVYKVGIQNTQYSFSTAVGLFNNAINFILLICVNKISRKVTQTSLW